MVNHTYHTETYYTNKYFNLVKSSNTISLMTTQTTSNNISALLPAHSLKEDLSFCLVFKHRIEKKSTFNCFKIIIIVN